MRNYYEIGKKTSPPPQRRAHRRKPKRRPPWLIMVLILSLITGGILYTSYGASPSSTISSKSARSDKPAETLPQWDIVLEEPEEQTLEEDSIKQENTTENILHNNWRNPKPKKDRPSGKPALSPKQTSTHSKQRPKEPQDQHPADRPDLQPQPSDNPHPPQNQADRFKIAVWFPFWEDEQAMHSLKNNGALIHEINFFWYDVQSDGVITLRPSMEGENAAALDLARKHNMQIIPTIGNNFDPDSLHKLLATAERRAQLADRIVELVTVKQYDGIDINFEPIHSADRDPFSLFMEELAKKLHAEEKLLAVSVYPKTEEPGSYEGQMAQDWNRLGRVVDIFKIKGYNYSWGEPGPSTPLHWIDKILTFAKQQVPAEKIQLGLPWYGYYWTPNKSQYTFYYHQAQELIHKKKASIKRDKNGEAYLTYIEHGQTRIGYVQDRYSYEAKVNQIRNNHPDIRAIAHWYIGPEDPSIWRFIRSLH